MKTTTIHSENDLVAMRVLLQKLGERSLVADFEEMILIDPVRETCRLWWEGDTLAGFALVDDYNNLWFEAEELFRHRELENSIVAWGSQIMSQRNKLYEAEDTLDVCLPAWAKWQTAMVERLGFTRQAVESYLYRLNLENLGTPRSLPEGYLIRPAYGEIEVDHLVDLHREAFETTRMDRELRLAMMRAPGYLPALDLVAITPSGKMAGFCIGRLDPRDPEIGFTDPIGVIPAERQKGLAAALVDFCLWGLKKLGVREARLGTSSENLATQHLAEALGFELVDRKCWYSLQIDRESDALDMLWKEEE